MMRYTIIERLRDRVEHGATDVVERRSVYQRTSPRTHSSRRPMGDSRYDISTNEGVEGIVPDLEQRILSNERLLTTQYLVHASLSLMSQGGD